MSEVIKQFIEDVGELRKWLRENHGQKVLMGLLSR
jgi:hypothetical protein